MAKVMRIGGMISSVAAFSAAAVLAACSGSGSSSSKPPRSPPPSGAAPTSPADQAAPAKPLVLRGTVDGGGGKGVLCIDSSGRRKLQTLDLYESEVVRGEKPDTLAAASAQEFFDLYTAKKLYPALQVPDPFASWKPSAATPVTSFFNSQFLSRLRPQRGPLPLTPDATLPALPRGCEIVQIAIWQKDGRIDLDEALWNELSPREQAALAGHEVIYAMAREFGALSSDEVRWVIGKAYSDAVPHRRFPETMFATKPNMISCHGGGGDLGGPIFEMHGQIESEGGTSGVALYLHYSRRDPNQNEHNPLTRTRAFLPGWTLDDLQAYKPTTLLFKNRFHGTNGWRFEFAGKSMVALKNSTASFPTNLVRITDPDGFGGLSSYNCKRP